MPTDNGNTSQQPEKPGEQQTPTTWETWLEAAPAEVKTLYEEHTAGLLSTVRATRAEREALKDQVKELLPKAEKGSEMESRLNETLSKLEATERRAIFVEEAVKPSIGCRNPKAAYALAVADNLFTRSGSPDWDAIKEAAPELFGVVAPPAKPGAGTGQPSPEADDMNARIRKAAGRS